MKWNFFKPTRQEPTFHNTNDETGQTLENSEIKAAKQESIVYDYFKERPEQILTPSDVLIGAFNQKAYHITPLTSVRRAMTNLTNKGYLVKTDTQRMGIYGKLTYCWKLA